MYNMAKYELKIYVFPEKLVEKWEEQSLLTNITLLSIVIFPPIKKPVPYNNWIVVNGSTKNQRGSPNQTILMTKATELKSKYSALKRKIGNADNNCWSILEKQQ